MRMHKWLYFDKESMAGENVPLLSESDEEWSAAQPNQQFNVVRRVYQQDALNKDANYHPPELTLRHKCKKILKTCGFGACLCNSLPIARWLPKYNPKTDLFGDVIAGATTAVMHIPQGMAYALLAEVPPIVGLYMAFFPVLIYVIFGTSPHISMGTFAVACLMAGKVVNQYAHIPDVSNATDINATDMAVQSLNATTMPLYTPQQVVSILCITVGFIQVVMWLLRLGAVSTLLSEPLVSGFTTAACFHVLASQLKDLLGIKIPRMPGNFKIIFAIIEVCKNLAYVNLAALTISIIACAVIALNNELFKPWLAKRCRIPMPIELLAIVVGTLVSRFGGLHDVFGISLVGHIPTGLPQPMAPPIELLPSVALDAFTITMVTYTITMSMALIFAAKEKYEVDANQELLALGASNIFGSFFSCVPICASLSRSYIQYQAGSKTPLTSAVSATLILFVLLWVGPVFEQLPRCVLAAIICVSLKNMVLQVKELKKFWRLSQLDAGVWLITFLTTMLINIDVGLYCGLLASVGSLFLRAQRPYTCLLGRVLHSDLYLDIKRYRAAEEIPGMKIFHYCGGLNFATKNMFRETLIRKVGCLKPIPTPDEDNNLARTDSYEWDSNVGQRVKCVIIDASAMSYVDAPGVRALVAARRDLGASGVSVLLAGANGPMQEMIEKYNKLEADPLQLDSFPTVHDAVVYFKVAESKKPDLTINVNT